VLKDRPKSWNAYACQLKVYGAKQVKVIWFSALFRVSKSACQNPEFGCPLLVPPRSRVIVAWGKFPENGAFRWVSHFYSLRDAQEYRAGCARHSWHIPPFVLIFRRQLLGQSPHRKLLFRPEFGVRLGIRAQKKIVRWLVNRSFTSNKNHLI